jgi:hypothetical protein
MTEPRPTVCSPLDDADKLQALLQCANLVAPMPTYVSEPNDSYWPEYSAKGNQNGNYIED